MLNLRIDDQIDEEALGRKQTDLRDRAASIKLQLDVVDRSHDETAESALNVFELFQALRDQWLTANFAAKRRTLEIFCFNCQYIVAKLCPKIRKPFEVLVDGLLVSESGGRGS